MIEPALVGVSMKKVKICSLTIGNMVSYELEGQSIPHFDVKLVRRFYDVW